MFSLYSNVPAQVALCQCIAYSKAEKTFYTIKYLVSPTDQTGEGGGGGGERRGEPMKLRSKVLAQYVERSQAWWCTCNSGTGEAETQKWCAFQASLGDPVRLCPK